MPKLATSHRLLDAAEVELIANQGSVEMAAVAKRAGVSVGLAYHHFGSKTGMIAAVIDRFYGPIRDIALGDRIPRETEWMAREKARAEALIGYFYTHPLAPLVAGRLAREPEVRDIEGAHTAALLDAGARNIVQGQRLGVVNPDLDPKPTVAMLMGGLRLAIDQAILSETRPNQAQVLQAIWLFIEGALHVPQLRTETGEIRDSSRAKTEI